MPTELEAKMQVADHEPIRQRLRDSGARHLRDVAEINTFFDTDARELLQADKGLRLRHERNLLSGEETFIITFKGPRNQGLLKRRQEVELPITDAAAGKTLLVCLGFHTVFSFQKTRQSWLLDGCHVELDTLPRLGCFVEIEGPGEEAILRVREKLGLASLPLLRATYVELLTAEPSAAVRV